jgi:GTPase Era involved in 16S rRNA processing
MDLSRSNSWSPATSLRHADAGQICNNVIMEVGNKVKELFDEEVTVEIVEKISDHGDVVQTLRTSHSEHPERNCNLIPSQFVTSSRSKQQWEEEMAAQQRAAEEGDGEIAGAADAGAVLAIGRTGDGKSSLLNMLRNPFWNLVEKEEPLKMDLDR